MLKERMICRQASKKEAAARATALKDKEKADKARFKEKRKEERTHKKEQAKRMQQERQQAGTSAPQLGGKSGGSRTTVGVFGFFSRPKKEEEKKEGEKAVTPESEAVGDAAIGAGPSRVGEWLSLLDQALLSASRVPLSICLGWQPASTYNVVSL